MSYTPYDLTRPFHIAVGKKHIRMGIRPEFFGMMGEALMETLRECLKDDFRPEVESAWRVVYAALSGTMVKAMDDQLIVMNTWNQLKLTEN